MFPSTLLIRLRFSGYPCKSRTFPLKFTLFIFPCPHYYKSSDIIKLDSVFFSDKMFFYLLIIKLVLCVGCIILKCHDLARVKRCLQLFNEGLGRYFFRIQRSCITQSGGEKFWMIYLAYDGGEQLGFLGRRKGVVQHLTEKGSYVAQAGVNDLCSIERRGGVVYHRTEKSSCVALDVDEELCSIGRRLGVVQQRTEMKSWVSQDGEEELCSIGRR